MANFKKNNFYEKKNKAILNKISVLNKTANVMAAIFIVMLLCSALFYMLNFYDDTCQYINSATGETLYLNYTGFELLIVGLKQSYSQVNNPILQYVYSSVAPELVISACTMILVSLASTAITVLASALLCFGSNKSFFPQLITTALSLACVIINVIMASKFDKLSAVSMSSSNCGGIISSNAISVAVFLIAAFVLSVAVTVIKYISVKLHDELKRN